MPSKKEEDDDPVITEYDVYITPKLSEQLYLLQFPTRARDLPYNEEHRNKPSEMRIKPQSGFIEMDVPLNTHMFYNRQKAGEWGNALAKAKSGGAKGHGLAVGFSQGGSKGAAHAHAEGETNSDHTKLLEHQTLGGQIIHDERGKPNYMVGTFLTDKCELHLTSLDGVVQMRPQFHHIDAKTQVDRSRMRRDRAAGDAPKEAQQVQMKYADGEQAELMNTKDLLDKAHAEAWKRMRFCDEEERTSYDSYGERLFLNGEQKQHELQSALNNETYLDAISAPRLDQEGKPRVKPMTKKQKDQINLSEEQGGATGQDGAASSG